MNFQEYLQHIGYSTENRSLEDIAIVRAEYKRFYQRNYHKNYRKGIKRLEINFDLKTYDSVIEKSAKFYGVKPTTLIHNVSLAYLNSEVYLPPFQSLEELTYLIRKSSNNINQLVYSSHRNQAIYKENLQALVAEVSKMEQNLVKFYQQPKVIYKPINEIKNADKIS